MRRLQMTVGLVISLSLCFDNLEARTFKNGFVENGWLVSTSQADPFDASVVKIESITSGLESPRFTIRCNELNMVFEDRNFDGFSFNAKLKYVVDDNPPVDKNGTYSTYLGGSDLINDQRNYFFKLNESDLEALRNGTSIKVAGNHGAGWESGSMDLEGLEPLYKRMCP